MMYLHFISKTIWIYSSRGLFLWTVYAQTRSCGSNIMTYSNLAVYYCYKIVEQTWLNWLNDLWALTKGCFLVLICLTSVHHRVIFTLSSPRMWETSVKHACQNLLSMAQGFWLAADAAMWSDGRHTLHIQHAGLCSFASCEDMSYKLSLFLIFRLKISNPNFQTSNYKW